MKVNAILACDLDYGIGKNNGLPWPRNSEDMKWFKDHTTGGVVLMGRKTWQSIGSKPLSNRVNVVVTTKKLEGPDYTTSGDMASILGRVNDGYPGTPIWVIGGADIYSQALPHCKKLYLTIFRRSFDCDAFVDSVDISQFNEIVDTKMSGSLEFQIRERMNEK